jgi:DNA-binding MarR family transcriptional regulator
VSKAKSNVDTQLEAGERRIRSVREGVEQYSTLLESPDPLAIGIILAIWEINSAQMLANEKAFEQLDLPVNVGGNRLPILRTLYFAPEQRMSIAQLSRKTGLTISWITSLVEALSAGGMVRRMGSPTDRRVTLVCLTDEGARAFQNILPLMGEAMSRTCRNLSHDEKQTFIDLLNRLLVSD